MMHLVFPPAGIFRGLVSHAQTRREALTIRERELAAFVDATGAPRNSVDLLPCVRALAIDSDDVPPALFETNGARVFADREVSVPFLAPSVVVQRQGAAPRDSLGLGMGSCADLVPWHLAAIHARAEAGEFSGRGILVGVLDIGLFRHPDLVGKISQSVRTLSTHTERGERHEGARHGTPVCGLIACSISGVAPGAMLAVANASLSTDPVRTRLKRVTVARALDWLGRTAHTGDEGRIGCDVINMSISADDGMGSQWAACMTALWEDFGIFNVIAAGNTGPGTLGTPNDCACTLTVGASRRDGSARHDSSTLRRGGKPEIYAPGEDICTCVPEDSHGLFSQTSAATPQVAAAAALILEKFPDLKQRPEELRVVMLRDFTRAAACGRLLDLSAL